MPAPQPTLQQARQLLAAGNLAGALQMARTLALRTPNDAECLQLLADTLAMGGALDEAAGYYERAVARAPKNAPLRNNYGWLLTQRREFARAEAELREALRLDPAYPGAQRNLVLTLLAARNTIGAIDAGRGALLQNPGDEVVARNLAIALLAAGAADEAVAVLRKARSIGGATPALQSLLACTVNYWQGASAEEQFKEHAELGRMMAAAIRPDAGGFGASADPERVIRIGYISQAFCSHSAGHFIEPVLTHHDRERVAVVCYSRTAQADGMTQRFRALPVEWVECRAMSPRALADRIRADRIDIAVDLIGHTSDTILPALCLRPAPIQMTYLGYPNTTGLPAIGHRIVDAITDPPGAERLSTESLIRINPCFLCYAPPGHAPRPAGAPPSVSTGCVTFGSFNTNAKLSAATLELWARILKAVPGSRLLLKNADLADRTIADLRRRELAEFGIEPARVELHGQTASPADHLAMYSGVDIALDPFPYNGTTTTVEALWMGVPVVALAGDSHVSRVGMSVLAASGLADLVAEDKEKYLGIAVGLAGDPGRLAALRTGLRDTVRGSALCDGAGFVSRLETAYREIWRNWCRSRIKA